jgi:hypothetical protein
MRGQNMSYVTAALGLVLNVTLPLLAAILVLKIGHGKRLWLDKILPYVAVAGAFSTAFVFGGIWVTARRLFRHFGGAAAREASTHGYSFWGSFWLAGGFSIAFFIAGVTFLLFGVMLWNGLQRYVLNRHRRASE